ncbi:hypothetical protein V8E36_001324 [Tilletia maclaganii]
MMFCKSCGNMLTVSRESGSNKWVCPSCPYEYAIMPQAQITQKVKLTRKQVDDVMGGEDQWKNVDKTRAHCPKCDNEEAYFMMIQTRSADEPMTQFYKCTRQICSHQWREA